MQRYELPESLKNTSEHDPVPEKLEFVEGDILLLNEGFIYASLPDF